jgi:restriction endonuclease
MNNFDITEPILDTPFEEQREYGRIVEDETPDKQRARREEGCSETGGDIELRALLMDMRTAVDSFVKNAGLGFAVPYFHNGEPHDYLPDFIVRLKGGNEKYLILETKGFDELESVKRESAERWVKAVNTDGKYGLWSYAVAKCPTDVVGLLNLTAEQDSVPKERSKSV